MRRVDEYIMAPPAYHLRLTYALLESLGLINCIICDRLDISSVVYVVYWLQLLHRQMVNVLYPCLTRLVYLLSRVKSDD